eukprot:c7685_g1_i2.p1 GENE.c7685_g1_i2~~c7685_g1_i2.p1  ORF type:complete len:1060 (+),score=263.76 c7685_g1_i2:48-3227(+)
MNDDSFPVLVTFEVWSPPPPSDFRIIVTGSIPQLGSWFTERPVTMELQGEGVWRLQLPLKSSDQFEYKYACYSSKEGRCVGYEQGPNRYMWVAAKLKEDGSKIDTETGLKAISVKDVWSAVQPANTGATGRRGSTATAVVPQVPQYGSTVETAANYIHQQVTNKGQSSSHRETELNQRLTKVVSEVGGLKQKLKDAQRDQMNLMKQSKEAEENYQKNLAKAQGDIDALRAEVTQLKSDRVALESKSDERIKSTISRLEQQMDVMKVELKQSKQRLDDALVEKEKLEKEHSKELDEIRGELTARETEISLISVVIEEFANTLEDENVKAEVIDKTGGSLRERLGTLLLHLEEQTRKFNSEKLIELRQQCLALRQSLEQTKPFILRDVQHAIKDSVNEVQSSLMTFFEEQQAEKNAYVERYLREFNARKDLAQQIIDMKGKIRVFGRARPFNERERLEGHYNVLAFPEPNRLLIGSGAEKFILSNDVSRGQDASVGDNKIDDIKTYELDHIFPPQTTQAEVFEEVRHLISSVLDGFNVTVFAYGQTGSGKTHTMDGSPDNPGISYRSLALFFDPRSGKRGTEVNVSVSMLEVYNEEIRDLLREDPGRKGQIEKLSVRQSPDGGSYVPNLLKVPANSLEDALRIMDMGRKNRITSETNMNAHSSRSHMVFTAYLEVINTVTQDKTYSKLHLVDLAGSERVSKSKATGEQLKEAMGINKSLSALGDVIAALTSRNKGQGFVPYRNSTLTFLLQDSLCGSSRTAMFVNMSPSSDNFWETISTLNFAARAASIELGEVQRNFQSGELSQLREQVSKLQNQLASEKGAVGGAASEASSLKAELSNLEKDVELKDKKLKALTKLLDEAKDEAAKAQDALNKKQDKLRADLKEKDDQIRELEDALKKAKRAPAPANGTSASGNEDSRELATMKKQVQELTKQSQQLEAKLLVAETRAKKAEKQSSKAEDDIRELQEQLKAANRIRKESGTADAPTLKGRLAASTPRMGGPLSSRTPRMRSPRDPAMFATTTIASEQSDTLSEPPSNLERQASDSSLSSTHTPRTEDAV